MFAGLVNVLNKNTFPKCYPLCICFTPSYHTLPIGSTLEGVHDPSALARARRDVLRGNLGTEASNPF